MARTIRLTRADRTTKVEVFESDILQYKMAVNGHKTFLFDGNTTFIRFPECDQLNRIALRADNLHADTVTLLSTPADNDALFEALVTAKMFNPEVA